MTQNHYRQLKDFCDEYGKYRLQLGSFQSLKIKIELQKLFKTFKNKNYKLLDFLVKIVRVVTK